MPKVKAFNPAQNRKRDEIADAMIREGASKSKAYAVSAATVKKMKRKKQRRL